MGWFSGIVSGVKTIFGTGQDGQSNVMKVASGVGNFIDEQKFTEEEKAEFNARMITAYADYMQSTVNENTQRSRTRRDIALWIIKTEVFLLVSSCFTFKFDPELTLYIYQVATESPMGYLTLGVGAFFFGAHLIRATQNEPQQRPVIPRKVDSRTPLQQNFDNQE